MLEITFPSILFTVINILVLLGGLTFFLFKPVNKILKQRQDEIDAGFQEIDDKKSEIEAKKAEYEEAMSGVDDEKASIISEAREKANKEYDGIVSDANKKAKDIIESAKKNAEMEKVKVLEQANTEIAELVIEATAKTMAGETDRAKDKALYDEFLKTYHK